MGRKVFVSYKYADNNVYNMLPIKLGYTYTVRDYVNQIQNVLGQGNIYKGESDGEDLSTLSYEAIWETLKNRIYDSSVTIIMVSKGMKENGKREKDQWIPQEISYSLKEMPRRNKNGDPIVSHTNALLAVVLPDRSGHYDYFMSDQSNQFFDNRSVKKDSPYIFDIMRGNLFNKKNGRWEKNTLQPLPIPEQPSYMLCVRWRDFFKNMNRYIEQACKIQEKKDEYIIQKEISS